jgi:hypothetical protein
MPTGPRGSHPVSPRDVTGRRSRELLREKAAREAAASEVIDLAAIKRRAFEDGHSAGWDAAISWVIEKMTDVGVDPDILVVADDDHQDDESAEDE